MKQPRKIVALLDYIGRSWNWFLQDEYCFFQQLRTRRIKYLRVFTVCPWGEQSPNSQPFQRVYHRGVNLYPLEEFNEVSENMYNLEEFNDAFFDKLKHLADEAGDFGTALIIDLFDHCGTNKKLRKNNPWYNNINGVKGFYDTSDTSMMFQRKLIKKIVDTIGFHAYRKTALGIRKKVRPHIYSLGNELYTAGGGTTYHWIGRDWALPHSLYLKGLGYKNEIFFSAHEKARHAIWEYVGPGGAPWGSTFKIKDTVCQMHGMAYTPWADDNIAGVAHGRKVSVSDDGTNIKYAGDKGICTNGDRYCSASINLVCSTLAYIKEVCNQRNRRGRRHRILHSMEMLPRSVSETYQTLKNLNQDRDLDVWTEIGERVYGQDWTRKTPRYLRKRYNLTTGQ